MYRLEERTSMTSPLRLDEVAVQSTGMLGLTLCPGKWDQNGTVRWRRDLSADLLAVKQWGATTVVSLIEEFEFKLLRVEELPLITAELGMQWHHLPIQDNGIPSQDFEQKWEITGAELHARLSQGERIMIHCRGGMGRTGTIAARLLIESGLEHDSAIVTVRNARSGAIEFGLQEQYVRTLKQYIGQQIGYE